MDFSFPLIVDHAPPWNLVVLLLAIYPIVILAPAAVCRRRGGSLLAFAFPAALTPLFVALALSWFEQARVLRALVVITRYSPAASALALSEALQALRLGACIAVVVVLILVLWEAVRRSEDRAQASRRWLFLPLTVLALLLVVEDVQCTGNLRKALPPNLFLASDLVWLAAGLSFAGALLSVIWLWHATRKGVVGMTIKWPGALTLLAALVILARFTLR